MVDRPHVGVTGPVRRLKVGWWATRWSLWVAGASATYVTANQPAWRRPVHGVVVGGGDDIHPQHYGAESDGKARYDPDRDVFEIRMLKRALDEQVPVLGICRGSQLLNIVLGGTLHQDIRALHRNTRFRISPWRVKTVVLEPASRLAEIMCGTEARVNSLHHQAIDRCGAGLKVVARDRNAIVHAVESNGGDFVMGVQWHPEYLPYRRDQRAIFRALVSAMRRSGRVLAADTG